MCHRLLTSAEDFKEANSSVFSSFEIKFFQHKDLRLQIFIK